MALRQGKYSALGKALGQYRTSLYDVMEKEHEKEFIAWQGEKDRAVISGSIGAVAQGMDLYTKMKDKSKQAKDTISYVESQGGGDVKRVQKEGILGKMQKGLEDVFGGAKYEVSGGAMEEGEYTAGQLRGQSQFHAVEAMNDPDRAEETRKKYADKKEEWAQTDITGDEMYGIESGFRDLVGGAGDLMGDAGDFISERAYGFKEMMSRWRRPQAYHSDYSGTSADQSGSKQTWGY